MESLAFTVAMIVFGVVIVSSFLGFLIGRSVESFWFSVIISLLTAILPAVLLPNPAIITMWLVAFYVGFAVGRLF